MPLGFNFGSSRLLHFRSPLLLHDSEAHNTFPLSNAIAESSRRQCLLSTCGDHILGHIGGSSSRGHEPSSYFHSCKIPFQDFPFQKIMSLSVSSKTTLALDHHLLQQSKHASNVELMSETAQVPSATAARRWKGGNWQQWSTDPQWRAKSPPLIGSRPGSLRALFKAGKPPLPFIVR